MSTYEREGVLPGSFAVLVRWTKAGESEAAKRLHSLPYIAPEVIRRVLEAAAETGLMDIITSQIQAQLKASDHANQKKNQPE